MLLVAAGVLLLIIASIAFAATRGGGNGDTGTGQQDNFQNWLKPASVIQVGSHRYVSPCRALPKQAAESAFGAFTPRTVVQETYLDRSVKDSLLPLQLKCIYNHGIGKGQDVALEMVEYSDASTIKRLGSSLGAFELGDVQHELSLYDKALAEQPNPTASQFLDKLKKSFATYKKYYDKYSQDELVGLNPNGLVLPVSNTIAGAVNDFAFVGVQDNVVYTLGHTPASAKGRNDVGAYSAPQLVNEMLSMKKATDAIARNIGNAKLDQSPAPTIFGSTDTHGSTTILEPCAILSATAYQQISGVAPEASVERTTVAKDITTKRYTLQDKALILPSNKCERQSESAKTGNTTYLTFTLSYGSSTQQATDWLSKYFKVTKGDQKLTTQADWAYAFANPIKSGYDPVVEFRVGPYIGSVSMYTNTDSGYAIASIAQYTQAINVLATSLKANVQNIQ